MPTPLFTQGRSSPGTSDKTEVLNQGLARAVNSAVECVLHTDEATGSIPVPPTKFSPYKNGKLAAREIPAISEDDFWRRVYRDSRPGACWPYGGLGKPPKHQRMKIGGVLYLPHRVAYTLAKGPIPSGMMVRHKCDYPPCCNPAHLEIGFARDNVRDMMERGRHAHQKRGALLCVEKISPKIREAIAACGLPSLRAAAKFGVSQRAVRRIQGRK